MTKRINAVLCELSRLKDPRQHKNVKALQRELKGHFSYKPDTAERYEPGGNGNYRIVFVLIGRKGDEEYHIDAEIRGKHRELRVLSAGQRKSVYSNVKGVTQ